MSEAMNQYPETLPASWYCDPSVFEQEQALIFGKHWTLVAREEQLARPGDYVVGDVSGRGIFVIRTRDGQIKGFHNVCRHRAGPVLRGGQGHCDVLRCAYHGWVYDHSGRLIKAPDFSEKSGKGDFDRSAFNLFAIQVASWNGMVFACLDEAAPDLRVWLGDIIDIADDFAPLSEMTYVHEEVLEAAANWKAYGDNSVEGYHVNHVHKILSTEVAGEEVQIDTYDKGGFVGFDVRYGGAGARGNGRGFWIYKFPGLLLHFAENSFNVERVIPLSPGRIRLVRWFWIGGKSNDETQQARALIANSVQVMHEDLGICEEVQRNLESGVYQTGRLSPKSEPGTIFFQRLVRKAMGTAT